MAKTTIKRKKENKPAEAKAEKRLITDLSPQTKDWLSRLPDKQEESLEEKKMKRPDSYQTLKFPLSTEKSIRQIEFDNKLTFIVDKKAKKPEIKRAVEELFKVKVLKINTQHDFKGRKKAYIKLSPESLASDISADLGLI